MNTLAIIDEHIVIRETVGYDGIKDIDVWDVPEVIRFLRVVYNYKIMKDKM